MVAQYYLYLKTTLKRINKGFIQSCKSGNIEVVKWSYSSDDTIINCGCDYSNYNTDIQLFISN